eukprot:14110952-Ditylum_brightwellii.AAC.1
MYCLVLDFPKDYLIKERAEAEDEDVVMIMAAEGVEEENLIGSLSQTPAKDCSDRYGGHGRHEGQDLEIKEVDVILIASSSDNNACCAI